MNEIKVLIRSGRMSYLNLLNQINKGILKDGKLLTSEEIFNDTMNIEKYKINDNNYYSINKISEIVYGNKNNSFRNSVINNNLSIKKNRDYFIKEEILIEWIKKSRKFEIYKIAIPLNTYSRFYREYMTLLPIIKAFPELTFIRQYHLPKDRYYKKGHVYGSYYNVDLYCKDLNLVIECDEYAHKFVCGDDKKREDFIKKTLNCKFIRFNPDDDNFNLQDIIDKICFEIHNQQLIAI
jgi:very-short-patch-repair endonuclease